MNIVIAINSFKGIPTTLQEEMPLHPFVQSLYASTPDRISPFRMYHKGHVHLALNVQNGRCSRNILIFGVKLAIFFHLPIRFIVPIGKKLLPHIFKMYAGEMFRQGYQFWISQNGVWQTKAVPTEYLEEV